MDHEEPSGAASASSRPRLSVVCPAHNESEVLDEMHRRLAAVLGARGVAFEWIVVDDGSTDGTFEVLRRLAAADRRVRALRLSRGFGHQAALLAGLRAARGAAVVTMDSDLQHPPERLPALLDAWESGFQVVTTSRREADHRSLPKRWAARAFYSLLRRATDLDIPTGSADYCLLDRSALDAVLALPEQRVFLRGTVRWIGFRRTNVEYDQLPRFAGTSSYSYARLARLAFDGIFSFSAAPTRMLFAICAIFSAGAAAYAAYILASVLRGGVVQGWPSVMLVLLAIGAVICLGLGILGEYVWRIYGEVRRRPAYIVAESLDGAEPVGPGGAGGAPPADRGADVPTRP